MNDKIFAQFHALPISVKNVVSSPEGMAAIEALEERYGVVLAELILRLIVRDVSLDELSGELETKQGMLPDQARALVAELEKGLLASLLSYVKKAKPAEDSPQSERQEPSNAPAPFQKTEKADMAQTPNASDIAYLMPVSRPAQQMRASDSAVAVTKVADARTALPANLPVAPQPTTDNQQSTINKLQIAVPPVRPPQMQPAIPAVTPIHSSAPVPAQQIPHETQSMPGIALQQLERGRKSDYFMSAEDEEEVGQHRKRLATYAAPVAFEQEVNTIIDSLIAKFHLTFTVPALERRLRTMIASRLHNVRSKTELQEMLQRSVKIGGMQYDARIAEQVAAEADSQAALLQDLRLLTHPGLPKQSEPPKDIVQQQEQPAVAERIPLPAPPQESMQPSIVPAPVSAKPDLPTARQESITQETAKRPMIVRRLQTNTDPDRPFLEDVRRPARPMDIADELGALTLREFRTLGSSADAAQKVLQKITLLTDESFLKRSEGIASWRNSEVCQLYLEIGKESMTSGKTVEQAIADREQQGKQTLSLQEFITVADLNQQMRL